MRLVVLLALALLVSTPATAQAPMMPPEGTIVVVVGYSDGVTLLPVGQTLIPPGAACP